MSTSRSCRKVEVVLGKGSRKTSGSSKRVKRGTAKCGYFSFLGLEGSKLAEGPGRERKERTERKFLVCGARQR